MLTSSKDSADYLALISSAIDEKTGVREYLTGLGEKDVVLEIGTGGGESIRTLSETVTSFAPDKRPIVIGVDISLEVLKRVTGLLEAANMTERNASKLKVFGVRADAIKLPFRDASVSLVNLSSIVHEVFSYGGGEDAVDMMVYELVRTVRQGGIVVYRDPEGVELFKSAVSFLDSGMIRLFAAAFFKKYLLSSNDGNDLKRRYSQDFRLSIDGRRIKPDEISAGDLLSAKTALLNCNSGLMHELKRHFVVFMTTFFPEVFKTVETSEENPDQVRCVFSRNSGSKVFAGFCEKRGLKYSVLENERTFTVDRSTIENFESVTNGKFESIFGDTILKCSDAEEHGRLKDFFDGKNVSYSIGAEDGLDIRVPFEEFVGVYPDLRAHVSDDTLHPTLKKEVKDACVWFEREGGESYFYGDSIDVLVTFVEESLIRDREHSVIGYSCFVPISVDYNKFVKRDDYRSYVSDSVVDLEGDYSDGKRNIHFVKKSVEEAFEVLFALYRKNGDERLRRLLDKLLDLAKTSLDTQQSYSDKRTAEDAVFPGKTNDVVVIGLVGGIASGKTSVGGILAEHGFTIFELSDSIRKELKELGINSPSRADYFGVANARRREKGNDYWVKRMLDDLSINPEGLDGNLIISGIRTPEEIEYLRSHFKRFLVMAVDAPLEVRVDRVRSRLRDIDPRSIDGMLADMKREMADDEPEGCQLAQALKKADILLDSSTKLEDLRNNCLAFLGSIGRL